MNLLFSSPTIDDVARAAVAKAVEKHRRLGQSIIVMRDGKITWIAPEDIPPLKDDPRSDSEK